MVCSAVYRRGLELAIQVIHDHKCITQRKSTEPFGENIQICFDNITCCHIEIEVAGQTVYFTQSQYTDTRPTILALTLKRQAPDRVATRAAILKSLVWLDLEKSPRCKRESNPRSTALKGDTLTTRLTR